MFSNMLTIEEKRALYMKTYDENKEMIDSRIADGIERYRKGDCRICLRDKEGNIFSSQKVKIKQISHAFKHGANIFMLDEIDNEEYRLEYRRFFKEYFNLATVPFYWDTLEPVEGKPRFAADSEKIYRRPAPDLCIEYCRENGIEPKLHCLVYDKFNPEWVKGLSLDEVKAKYEKRFQEISKRYAGKMYEFEVINEIFCAPQWEESKKTPISYYEDVVEWAFELAQNYFPKDTLVINEGNPLPDLAKQGRENLYYQRIKRGLDNGAPIHKIGLQHHLFAGVQAKTEEEYDASIKENVDLGNPLLMYWALDTIAGLGLPLELTEVTVPTFGDTPEDEQLQADMLKLWYSVWFSHPAVEGIVYWNTLDGYAFIDETWNENNCRGGLMHHDLTPKKSALMLKSLFHDIWHTELELTTDEDGFIEFRGFYGDYTAEVNGETVMFSICK